MGKTLFILRDFFQTLSQLLEEYFVGRNSQNSYKFGKSFRIKKY